MRLGLSPAELMVRYAELCPAGREFSGAEAGVTEAEWAETGPLTFHQYRSYSVCWLQKVLGNYFFWPILGPCVLRLPRASLRSPSTSTNTRSITSNSSGNIILLFRSRRTRTTATHEYHKVICDCIFKTSLHWSRSVGRSVVGLITDDFYFCFWRSCACVLQCMQV